MDGKKREVVLLDTETVFFFFFFPLADSTVRPDFPTAFFPNNNNNKIIIIIPENQLIIFYDFLTSLSHTALITRWFSFRFPSLFLPPSLSLFLSLFPSLPLSVSHPSSPSSSSLGLFFFFSFPPWVPLLDSRCRC